MKTLHFNLYNDSKVGMCNVMMSVENALIIAYLTKRDKIIFYGKESLYNSTTNKKIFDLFDIKFNYEIVESNIINQNISSLPCDFHNTCFYYKSIPSKDFVNNRVNIIDLSEYENIEEFRTINNNTLAYYSYLFYIKENRKEILEFVKNTFVPKQQYLDVARNYIDSIKNIYSNYNCIHFRRGDYLYTDNTKNKSILAKDVVPILKQYLSSNELLLIHSDETDESYFNDIKEQYPNIWLIDKELDKLQLDNSEKGLISLLIASYSNNFIGTLFSTFTGYIQRYRMYNGLKEDFKYLYSQRDNLTLLNGRFKEDSFGLQTWNRVKLPTDLNQIAFWFREWQESYPQIQEQITQSISVHPDFLSEEESNYIIAKAKENKPEFYERENRNRLTIHVNNDVIIKNIIQKACDRLGYNFNNIEPSLQIFTQYEEGQTFSHTDSLYEDYQGKRISSVLFYLNDDFEGSYIDFAYIGLRIKPKKGMMFAYPLVNEFNEQDKRWTHSASLITKGTKYMCYFTLKERNF